MGVQVLFCMRFGCLVLLVACLVQVLGLISLHHPLICILMNIAWVLWTSPFWVGHVHNQPLLPRLVFLWDNPNAVHMYP